MNYRLSLVIPTYNEREGLAALVEAIFAVFTRSGIDGELVIVDDNSPDGTGALADELARHRPIIVVHRPRKMGLGTAVIDGAAAATGTVVGVIDGDFSHPPDLLPAMLDTMGRYDADMVVGSRYVGAGGTRDWSVLRWGMSRLACVLAGRLTPVQDATSGFFLFKKSMVPSVARTAGGFKICLELLVRGRPKTVVEMPYVFEGRTAGQSKMNLREAVGYLKQLRDLRRARAAQPALEQRYVLALPDDGERNGPAGRG